MINIITGSVNSEKSTKIVNIYKSLCKGDGFFNKKIYNGNQRCFTFNKELYVVIRKSCLKKIISKYNIKDYRII